MDHPKPEKRRYGVPDDENPELTEEAIRRSIPAKQFFAERGLPLPGRPKSEAPKISVSLRLDPDVVAGFKADGPGWQTRINAVLAESLKRKKSA
ncbi:BrnA antitoxin family protein [Devosia ginsengisoli]|uniref:BrnA antitoxin family protein n=1 Tax=Devosia ginsengisoli TaxID=400770 RepID=A0A5B8LUP3_9HYPH|nr:BrnA antitoxin family protein [Devosia ginsengisoli]QDZ12037.1 BrnA antitoxin family protein [Devosia ginsengisoli]